MTSCRLPRTGGYPECLVWGEELGTGNTQPHPHHAATVPCPTQQAGCWPRERLIEKLSQGAETLPVGASKAAGLGSSAGEVYEG